MSVFSDFQRMWVQRFPQSSLSDAWEQDVRASLARHKQKISELTKELEQETLYVEYLERLLSDVEKFRDAGGDPSALFEANTPASAANLLAGSKDEDKDKPSGDGEPDQGSIIKAAAQQHTSNDKGTNGASTAEDDASGEKDHSTSAGLVALRRDNQHKDSALNQCINELTSNLHQRRCVSSDISSPTKSLSMSSSSSPTSTMVTSSSEKTGVPNSANLSNHPQDNASESEQSRSRRSSQSDALLSSPSHFVTVIEVKESSENASKAEESKRNSSAAATPALPVKATSDNSNNNPTTIIQSTTTASGKPNNYENVLINTNRGSCENLNNNSVHHGHMLQHQSSQQNNNNNSVSEHSTFLTDAGPKHPKPSAPPLMGSSIAERTSQLIGGGPDLKKKVPPRPPPKYPRRAAPVEPPVIPAAAMHNLRRDQSSDGTPDSPGSSLERNIKPSEIYRQKSSDSLDVKLGSRSSKASAELTEEFGKKLLPKSDSLKSKASSTDSPTGSLGKNVGASPTGSLGKLAHTTGSSDSPTGSLGKMSHQANDSLQSVGSKESLASAGGGTGAISERIKSYESISSLSSDSMRVGPGAAQAETEHYYDTVPLENGDGDYVYIQAGGTGTGSTSSRDDISTAGSTLPMPVSHPRSHNSSQTSVQLEPESPGRSSNYVNIDYFIHSICAGSSQNHEHRTSSIDSDGEADGGPPVLLRAISNETDSGQSGLGIFRKISNANRNTIIRHIVTSIITSETLYVECLNKMKQYMKAIRATLTTSQPVISEEEFQTIFFKIEELHEVHSEFLNELKIKQQPLPDGEELCVGEVFRRLASHIHLYGAFLHNYGRAIDTVKKCSTHSQQFKEIVSNIVFKNQNEQSLSLEELLHKPVARVQKNALVLEDLVNQTPEQHPDYHPLRQASKTIRTFLSEFNVVQTKSMFPSDDKALRRLVKNSFIVELADGHRKLRHLFLFNDVIACAKYKAAGRDRNGFEFELKWFIPLKDIVICEESANDPKETSPINIVHLKSQACTVRDQIMLDEKDERKQRVSGSRAGDKHRKKLADLEAQLVLASPNLVFKIGNKATGKTMTFFLSSDFERTQWIESILTLQQSCNLPGQVPVQIYDLQAWITACQALIKTEMGSYLMRNARDESLLVGDLHLTIQSLSGFEQPCDLFICVEIDSYGHYFRKAKTKLVCRSASPNWNESFVLELEGSQNLRILLYQDDVQRPILRAKQILKLSRQWLQEAPMTKILKLSETLALSTVIRFVPGEVTLRRVPTSKPGALFGAKLQQVIKREKRDIPFIVSACVREVERRGMSEVGIYRVSGSASDVAKLKKSFETNAYEAEQLLKEVDIHSVTGILKSYLRDLPEALFTDQYYPKFFETFNRHSNLNEASRIEALQKIFVELPPPNKATINLLLDHLMRVHQQEIENKMSLHNLAMVFGPTLLRPGPTTTKQKDLLESSTADVMTQAGILYSFLQARLKVPHRRGRPRLKPIEDNDQSADEYEPKIPGKRGPRRKKVRKSDPSVCDICGQTVAYFVKESHHNQHLGVRPYKCDYEGCGRTYFSQNDLRTHSKRHKITYHVCEICGRNIKGVEWFRRHMKTHTEVPQFTCEVCGSKFRRKAQLQTHMVTHTGLTPHECETCGKRFALKYNLEAHVKRHQKKGVEKVQKNASEKRTWKYYTRSESSGPKHHVTCETCGKSVHKRDIEGHVNKHLERRPYSCDVPGCTLAFYALRGIKEHKMVVHSDKVLRYDCSICNRSIKGAGTFKRHVIMHNSAMKVECQHCGKKFTSKSYLKAHEQKHSGERPFVCDLCGRSFAMKPCWKTHMKNQHNQDYREPTRIRKLDTEDEPKQAEPPTTVADNDANVIDSNSLATPSLPLDSQDVQDSVPYHSQTSVSQQKEPQSQQEVPSISSIQLYGTPEAVQIEYSY